MKNSEGMLFINVGIEFDYNAVLSETLVPYGAVLKVITPEAN